MSSTSIVLQPPAKTQSNRNTKSLNTSANSSSKRKSKHEQRGGRKRSKSFSGCGLVKMLCQKPVPPTKFLLGGNINDPLNLNSLQNEEINRAMNAVTPKSSPIPTPPRRKGQVEVIIPPNIHDPLNLIDCADDAEYEQQLCSPVKKGRKKRLKKRRTVSACLLDGLDDECTFVAEAKTPETSTDSAKIPVEEVKEEEKVKTVKDLTLELSPKKEKSNKRKVEEHPNPQKKFKYSMDKIVSPVVPQPGAWLKRSNSVVKQKPRRNKNANPVMPQFKEKNKQFQYGNYNRYYGYRNPYNEIDHRLKVFSHHRYLLEGKDILDIGCNIGHITLSIARDFGAKSITGIDIDPKLIAIARKNVKHYVKNSNSPEFGENCANAGIDKSKNSEFFPISMPILYGPIDIPGFSDNQSATREFPYNVVFKKCNYILEDDALLSLEQPQYDIILCLSVTKWVHLNWGDAGLKQAFRRMYAQLRPGGKLILEPQNWASYKSKCKLTEAIYKNYNTIEFFPDKFTEYLLSSVVGFAKSEILGYPHTYSKGFRRPIQIFTKSTMFLSERIEATPNNNITPTNPVYDDSIYQKIMKTEKYESQSQPQVEKSEHIYYTNILNRYCGNSDENDEVNKMIAADLDSDTPPNPASSKTGRQVIVVRTRPPVEGASSSSQSSCSNDKKMEIDNLPKDNT